MADQLPDRDGGLGEGNGALRGNFTIEQFMSWAAVRRTTTYAEISAGRLVALKCGNRTLIPVKSAEAWRAALPRLKGAGSPAGGADD